MEMTLSPVDAGRMRREEDTIHGKEGWGGVVEQRKSREVKNRK